MTNQPSSDFDVQGHRGCRGLMPENSIPAFLLAIELGVNTLEMDVVISKDQEVVVSHEPYFSHEISTDPQGNEISADTEKSHNLYALTIAEIQAYDCGSKPHPRFPAQVKTKVYKPMLKEVFDRVEPLVKEFNLSDLKYNIEIKRSPEGDNIFHPQVKEFVQLVVELIQHRNLQERVIIQSFDPETLQLTRALDPAIELAWLVENHYGLERNLEILGFLPEIYSPDYSLIDADLVKDVHAKGIKIIPWTVNDPEHILQMFSLGVDGIISDFPDRVKSLVGGRS